MCNTEGLHVNLLRNTEIDCCKLFMSRLFAYMQHLNLQCTLLRQCKSGRIELQSTNVKAPSKALVWCPSINNDVGEEFRFACQIQVAWGYYRMSKSLVCLALFKARINFFFFQ